MAIKYLNEYKRKNPEAAMKQIEEWRKTPIDLQKILKMQDESLKRIMEEKEQQTKQKDDRNKMS